MSKTPRTRKDTRALTDRQVLLILKSPKKQAYFVKKYGVCHTVISCIRRGKTYKDIWKEWKDGVQRLAEKRTTPTSKRINRLPALKNTYSDLYEALEKINGNLSGRAVRADELEDGMRVYGAASSAITVEHVVVVTWPCGTKHTFVGDELVNIVDGGDFSAEE